MSSSKWWKNPRVIGRLAYVILNCLRVLIRIKLCKSPQINPQHPYLFAFWHGNQLLPSLVVMEEHKTELVVMASPSLDGAMLSEFLRLQGYNVIRGSSRDNNIRALLQMKRKLDSGASVGFAIDGPIGPIHIVKPGIAYLAQKCRIKIIPVGSASSRYWTFNKAWDKFQLPKPFCKAAVVLGEPFAIAADCDINDACLEIERKVHQAQERARAML